MRVGGEKDEEREKRAGEEVERQLKGKPLNTPMQSSYLESSAPWPEGDNVGPPMEVDLRIAFQILCTPPWRLEYW